MKFTGTKARSGLSLLEILSTSCQFKLCHDTPATALQVGMHCLAVSLQNSVCCRQGLSECTTCTWCLGLRNQKETKT